MTAKLPDLRLFPLTNVPTNAGDLPRTSPDDLLAAASSRQTREDALAARAFAQKQEIEEQQRADADKLQRIQDATGEALGAREYHTQMAARDFAMNFGFGLLIGGLVGFFVKLSKGAR